MNAYLSRSHCKFHVFPLTDAVYDRLISIPGVEPWHPFGQRSCIVCPLSAGFIVQRELERAKLQYRYEQSWAPATKVTWEDVWSVLLSRGVYDWVEAWLSPAQKRCIVFAVNEGYVNVWMEPGAGKTAVAILSAVYLNRPVVVTTLASALWQTSAEWSKLVDCWPHIYKTESAQLVRDESLDDYLQARRENSQLPIVIMSWGLVRDHGVELADKMRGVFGKQCTIVFDEADKAKDPKRKKFSLDEDGKLQAHHVKTRSSQAALMAGPAGNVLCTTATSVADGFKDLWGQLTLLEPKGWGLTAKRYIYRYGNVTENQYGYKVDGVNSVRAKELQERLAFNTIQIPYEESHGHLPPKRRQMVRISVEDQIKEVGGINAEARKAQRAVDKGDKTAGMSLLRLRLERAASRKRSAIPKYIAEYRKVGKGKVVLFTGVRKDVDDLCKRLERTGAFADVLGADGRKTPEEREKVRQEYMAHPGPCVLVATWQSAGTALNLDDTDLIAFARLPYTPREIAQGEGRGDRVSMTRPLMYMYFVADGTEDENVVDIVMKKVKDVKDLTPGSRLLAGDSIVDTLRTSKNLDDATKSALLSLFGDEK